MSRTAASALSHNPSTSSVVQIGARSWAAGTSSPRRLWWSTFGVLTAVYAATAHWYGVTNIDTVGAAWPAWNLVHNGSLYLDGTTYPDIPWFAESGGHIVSNRMAGVVLVGVPAQLLLAPFDVSPLTPAIVTAVVVTAAAMANMALLLFRASAGVGLALASTVTLALGTGFWTNASAELWPHGPTALWLTLTMLAVQRHRYWLAGLALVPALWTRPHLAVAAALVGVGCSLAKRRTAPVLRIGVVSASGLAGLLLWNRAFFGTPSVNGGYPQTPERVVASSPDAWRGLLESAAGSLASPLHGLITHSPVVLVAVVALCWGFRYGVGWASACALGGLAYMVVQWKLNSFTGGTGLYSYRLPLEMLTLCTPAATLGYLRLTRDRPSWALGTRLLAGASIAIHVLGVYWYTPMGPRGQDHDAWSVWGPLFAATNRGPAGAVLAGLTCIGVIVIALRPRLTAARPDVGVQAEGTGGRPREHVLA